MIAMILVQMSCWILDNNSAFYSNAGFPGMEINNPVGASWIGLIMLPYPNTTNFRFYHNLAFFSSNELSFERILFLAKYLPAFKDRLRKHIEEEKEKEEEEEEEEEQEEQEEEISLPIK